MSNVNKVDIGLSKEEGRGLGREPGKGPSSMRDVVKAVISLSRKGQVRFVLPGRREASGL